MPPRPRLRPPKAAVSPSAPKLTPAPTPTPNVASKRRSASPPTSFSIPSSLTCVRLRDLAFHVGASMGTGRKADMIAELEYVVQTASPSASALPPASSLAHGNDKAENVLVSIDMGIRNFAICVLATGNPSPADVQETHRENVTAMTRPLWTSTPRVLAWRKYDLLELWAHHSRATAPPAEATTATTTHDSDPAHPHDADVDAQLSFGDINTTDIPALAVRVVRDIILPLVSLGSQSGVVDRVAIEHQRHRSGGAKGVLQTTIMVNSLEVSIDTLMHGLRSFGIPACAPASPSTPDISAEIPMEVPPTLLMDPKKVSDYWVREAQRAVAASKTRRLKSAVLRKSRTPLLLAGNDSVTLENLAVADTSADTDATPDTTRTLGTKMKLTMRAIKTAKIAVLKSWLEAGVIDLATPEAQAVGRAFLPVESPATKTPTVRKSRAKKKADAGADADADADNAPAKKTTKSDPAAVARARKMDDLADCLLQGLYVLRIDENRRAMHKWNVDAFLQAK